MRPSRFIQSKQRKADCAEEVLRAAARVQYLKKSRHVRDFFDGKSFEMAYLYQINTACFWHAIFKDPAQCAPF